MAPEEMRVAVMNLIYGASVSVHQLVAKTRVSVRNLFDVLEAFTSVRSLESLKLVSHTILTDSQISQSEFKGI